jgi:hypothetical protein
MSFINSTLVSSELQVFLFLKCFKTINNPSNKIEIF